MKTMSRHAEAAKQIRAQLKVMGVYAKVRSDRASMTSSVDVYLIDATPEIKAAVEKIAHPYQYGHFNGMEDIYEYTNTREDIPQVKFVFVNNQLTDNLRSGIYAHIRNTWSNGSDLPESYEAARNVFFVSGNSYIQDMVYRQFAQADSDYWASAQARKAA